MGEVVLLRHLVPALKKLNPKAPAEAIDAAVTELTRTGASCRWPLPTRWLQPAQERGEGRSPQPGRRTGPERIRVIDWDTPRQQPFPAGVAVWVTGDSTSAARTW